MFPETAHLSYFRTDVELSYNLNQCLDGLLDTFWKLERAIHDFTSIVQ